MDAITAKTLEQKRRKALRSRNTEDKHVYFQGIAQTRYALRRIFRIVEEKAKGVLEIADTVSFLSLGRITWSGPKSAVDDDLLAQVYLGQVEA